MSSVQMYQAIWNLFSLASSTHFSTGDGVAKVIKKCGIEADEHFLRETKNKPKKVTIALGQSLTSTFEQPTPWALSERALVNVALMNQSNQESFLLIQPTAYPNLSDLKTLNWL